MASRLPKLRDDLIIVKQVSRGVTTNVVKDPITLKYFKFGSFEFGLMELLDGQSNLKVVVENFNKKNPDDEIEVDDLKEFLAELGKMNLLEKNAAERNVLLLERMRDERASKLTSKKGSALYKRVPFFDPDRLFNKIHPYIKWFWSKPCVCFCFFLMFLASLIIGYNWAEVLEGIIAIYTFADATPQSLLYLWLTLLIVIGFHEFGHGLTCKNFGGEVHEIGFLLLFFQPCLYANVTDAYSFPNQRHKLYVTFAGIYVEFLIGTFACFLWFLTDPTTNFNAICYQVMTICGFSGVLFNLNPLVKFDGYFALAEVLDMPNLKGNSKAYVEEVLKRYILRIEPEEENPYTRREKIILFVYGIASSLWITLMLIGIFFLIKDFILESLYEYGVITLLVILYLLFKKKIMIGARFVGNIYKTQCAMNGSIRTNFLATIIVSALLGMFFLLPWKMEYEKEITIEPGKSWAVRAQEAGFIEELFTSDDAHVEEGDPLFRVVNSDQSMNLSRLRGRLTEMQSSKDVALAEGDISTYNELKLKEGDIWKEHAYIKKATNRLMTSSPAAGRIYTENILELQGKNVSIGQEVMKVVSLDTVYFLIELTEKEVGDIKPGETKAKIKVQALPKLLFDGVVKTVELSADTGATVRKFRAKVEVPNPTRKLIPGMTGFSRLSLATGTPYIATKRWVEQFFRKDILIALDI